MSQSLAKAISKQGDKIPKKLNSLHNAQTEPESHRAPNLNNQSFWSNLHGFVEFVGN